MINKIYVFILNRYNYEAHGLWSLTMILRY